MNLKQKLGLSDEPLYLMDGTAFIYRGFYANRHLQRADGFPTNSLVLVTRLLLRILRDEKPKYLVFAMDGKGKNFRQAIYDQYKANRESMPEDLAVQIEPIKRMVSALGLSIEVARDYEADDCIASFATRFGADRPVIIISGDKDLKQCLRHNIFMWDPAAKDEKILTMAEFESETGVSPEHWPDMQALIGDSSDNIPGVPGIGPKTAFQIFGKCQTLEEIRDHLDRLPPKIQGKLAPHLEEMFRWRRLTTLRTDLFPDYALSDLAVKKISVSQCEELAKEFELVAVGKEIASLANLENDQTWAEMDQEFQKPLQNALAHLELPLIENEKELPECLGKSIAIIPSTDHPSAVYVAVGAGEITSEFLWQGKTSHLCKWLASGKKIILPALKPLLEKSESWRKFYAAAGAGRFMDLGLASYLLNPEDDDYGWTRISARWRETLHCGDLGPAGFALAMAEAIHKNLQANGLLDLYENIELPLASVLAEMERLGFAIDPEAFRNFLADVRKETEKLSEEVFDEAGLKFNIRSSGQLAEVLFVRLGLPAGRKTKGGRPSTSELALEKLADNPVVAKVLKFRKYDKMQSTYLEPLPRLMDANNRIHTTFNQEVTATGRISSSNPNLQNIPVRGKLGARMRACFVPGKDRLLLAADYSQIELRILAHLSRDATLLDAFQRKEDIHARTAALVFDVKAEDVQPDQRRMAKTINFGLLYGMGARKLAAELKIGDREAQDFIKRYFSRLGGLKAFYEEVLSGARENGFVSTMSGRRRWLPGITSANGQIQAQAERQAVNAVIQGSAADIIKMAMLSVSGDPELAKADARLVLQVHDELLLEAPADNAREACARVAFLMEQVKPQGVELSVPLAVDWGIGKTWAEAH